MLSGVCILATDIAVTLKFPIKPRLQFSFLNVLFISKDNFIDFTLAHVQADTS